MADSKGHCRAVHTACGHKSSPIQNRPHTIKCEVIYLQFGVNCTLFKVSNFSASGFPSANNYGQGAVSLGKFEEATHQFVRDSSRNPLTKSGRGEFYYDVARMMMKIWFDTSDPYLLYQAMIYFQGKTSEIDPSGSKSRVFRFFLSPLGVEHQVLKACKRPH
jgi:hypothetical protein